MVSTLIAYAVPVSEPMDHLPQKPDFAEVCTRYYERVLRYLLVRTENRELAEELTQEVFLKALEAYGRFEMRQGLESPASWIFRIAHNTLVSHRRHVGALALVELDEVGYQTVSESLEEDVARKLERDRLRLAVRYLPEKQQLVMALTFFFDFGQRQIANVLAISESNVKVIKHKATRKLKLFLEDGNFGSDWSRSAAPSLAETVEVTRDVLDGGLPATSLKPSHLLVLKAAEMLERLGYRFKDVLGVWPSLPEGFFERILTETSHNRLRKVPRASARKAKPIQRRSRAGLANAVQLVEETTNARQFRRALMDLLRECTLAYLKLRGLGSDP